MKIKSPSVHSSSPCLRVEAIYSPKPLNSHTPSANFSTYRQAGASSYLSVGKCSFAVKTPPLSVASFTPRLCVEAIKPKTSQISFPLSEPLPLCSFAVKNSTQISTSTAPTTSYTQKIHPVNPGYQYRLEPRPRRYCCAAHS